jgi:hypothetical protein
MNRRTLLASIGTFAAGAIAVPKFAFGNKPISQWWYEKDSEFEGTPLVYYRWPKDRRIELLTENGDSIVIPTFDLRESTSGIEQLLRHNIAITKKYYKLQYLHIVQYEGSDQIGIMVNCERCVPRTDFSPEICVERRKRLWSKHVDLSKRLDNFRKTIKSNEYLIAGMKKFFSAHGIT